VGSAGRSALRLAEREAGKQAFREDERSARLAANEAALRAGNESIDAVLGDLPGSTTYLCECGDDVAAAAEDLQRAVRDPPAALDAYSFAIATLPCATCGEAFASTSWTAWYVRSRAASSSVSESASGNWTPW
jgi:hypothetical protein